jgi:hypothetical protein
MRRIFTKSLFQRFSSGFGLRIAVNFCWCLREALSEETS